DLSGNSAVLGQCLNFQSCSLHGAPYVYCGNPLGGTGGGGCADEPNPTTYPITLASGNPTSYPGNSCPGITKYMDVSAICGTCTSAVPNKRVFVSTTRFTPNQGVATADTLCQTDATTLGLTGTYKAWLSTSTTSASAHVTHSTGAYVKLDGTTI